ncbi:MAG: proteasome subunit alpha [Candidatus Heimdallarchaeota archaeon]|nr:proteasome subunit alpha [Candidatus Heimdallarchaeota archaeon]
MFGSSANAGYDRGILYSPEGRIIQTEYAREAMRRGRIAIGLRSNKAVVLAGKVDTIDLDIPNPKISKIGDGISAIFSGYAADGRVLISRARVEAAIHRMTYEDQIDIKALSTKLADYAHQYTLSGGVRPLGIGLLIGGVDVFDNTPRIFFLNPGGGLTETKAKAIGQGDAKAIKFIKDKHAESSIDDMSVNELIKLAQETIRHVLEEPTIPDEEIETWSISV